MTLHAFFDLVTLGTLNVEVLLEDVKQREGEDDEDDEEVHEIEGDVSLLLRVFHPVYSLIVGIHVVLSVNYICLDSDL